MKLIFLLILLVFLNFLVYAIERPILKTGINSSGNINKIEDSNSIYPTSLKDNIYSSFEENFTEFFMFKHKIDIDYTNYNKYSKNIDELQTFILNNYINFEFKIFKLHQLIFLENPSFLHQYANNFYKNTSVIQYKFNYKYFSLDIYYLNQFTVKNNEVMLHKIYFGFYWNIPKFEFLKFKSSFYVYLQNGFTEKQDISVLKSFSVNFEFAIDFNKINFEILFDKKEYDSIYSD